MKQHTCLFYFLFIFSNYTEINAGDRTNFVVKSFKLCDSKVNYPIKVYVTPHTVGNKQHFDGNATLAIPLDEKLKSNFSVEMLVGKNYVHMFSFNEKDSCRALHRYMGEFMYEIERAAQLVPGLCPIPVGRYHIHNMSPNFEKITLQTFPFGDLRLTADVTDKKNAPVTCVTIEVYNRINM